MNHPDPNEPWGMLTRASDMLIDARNCARHQLPGACKEELRKVRDILTTVDKMMDQLQRKHKGKRK